MPACTTNPHALAGVIARLNAEDYDRWAAQVRSTGRLLHRYTTRSEPDGVLRVPCKTRRASRCSACAEVYRADTYQLIRAGLIGGKGVPETVTGHPTLFVTLTAPTFGAVHTRRDKNGKVLPCHARRNAQTCPHGRVMSCTTRHSPDDPHLGEPLCPDCYDYTGSVLFNALAPLLWKRFADSLRRRLAKLGGLTLKELREHLIVSFAKVAEYQRRGVVHFHAVIRLDGSEGPATSPPTWATTDALTQAVRHAAQAVSAEAPAIDNQPARLLKWGTQLDTRPITLTGDLTEQAVAGYIAKYATKAAECVGTLDRRINPLDNLDAYNLRDHPKRLITECLRLGSIDDLAELRLANWAHMLGFRGHFSTRSRHYSTTLGELRAAREHHARDHKITTGRLPLFEEDTVLVISEWTYAGKGYSLADQLVAAAISGTPVPDIPGGAR